MSRVIRYMVCTVVLLLAGGAQVLACSCPVFTPEQNFNISEAVFAGTVLHVAPDSSGKFSLVSFDVDTVWKGNLTSEMLIGTERGSCHYSFEEGKAYLVYAMIWSRTPGLLLTDICMRTEELSEAGEDLAWLGEGTPVAVEDDFGQNEVPRQLTLYPNYPNPFSDSTVILFSLATPARVSLKVYDIYGREVASLVDGLQQVGVHEAVFDAAHLASGTYIYRLEAAGQIRTGRVLLLK